MKSVPLSHFHLFSYTYRVLVNWHLNLYGAIWFEVHCTVTLQHYFVSQSVPSSLDWGLKTTASQLLSSNFQRTTTSFRKSYVYVAHSVNQSSFVLTDTTFFEHVIQVAQWGHYLCTHNIHANVFFCESLFLKGFEVGLFWAWSQKKGTYSFSCAAGWLRWILSLELYCGPELATVTASTVSRKP